MIRPLIVVAAAFAFGACAGRELPAKQLADSEAQARAAEQANALQVPQAALHLQMAREHLAKAQNFIKEKDYDLASRSLKRAKADADSALALAETDKAQRDADAATNKVQTLNGQSGVAP